MQEKKKKNTTSWENVSSWYNQAVGDHGHYYHEKVILPNFLKWIDPTENNQGALLDLACGQGILSRHLPTTMDYVGIDISPSLLQAAREKNNQKHHMFLVADITKPLPITKKDFSFCTSLLALQNVENPLKALQNAAKHLSPKGKLLLVIMNIR